MKWNPVFVSWVILIVLFHCDILFHFSSVAQDVLLSLWLFFWLLRYCKLSSNSDNVREKSRNDLSHASNIRIGKQNISSTIYVEVIFILYSRNNR